MSDFRAIGGVSATLQTLLHDRMELPDGLNDVLVVVGPPPLTPPDEPIQEDPRVSLFLYRVSENGFLQNQDIPGNGSRGAYGKPPLSLNLHYLLTATGNTQVQAGNGSGAVYDETLAHFLLGSAMRVLHDYPQIEDSLTTLRVPTGQPIVHDSLQEAYERVKLSLEPLTLEDVTKVWTALALRYRLSAAYSVTVVQIESLALRTFPRPVGAPASAISPPPYGAPPAPGPAVYVVTMRTPYITDILVRRALETVELALPYARVGDTLVILGTQLSGGSTRAALGQLEIPVTPISDTRVEVAIPDASILGMGTIPADKRLQPGPLVVSVLVSEPYLPTSASGSNESVVMLVPAIALPLSYNPASRALTIKGTRLWNETTSGVTVIGRSAVDRSAYTSANDTQISMTLPITLPASPIAPVISDALPATVAIPSPATLLVTIDGTALTVSPNWPASVAFADLPALLANAIHDAAAGTPATNVPPFTALGVGTIGSRLVVVSGTLTSSIAITASGGSTLANALGFAGVPPPGHANVALSGSLSPFPTFAGTTLGLTMQVAGSAAIAIAFDPPLSIDNLASNLQAAVVGAGADPAYLNALVGYVNNQLVIVPGVAGDVTFSAAPPDLVTVSTLQLHANFSVRVRVNGAESFDDVSLELP